MIARSERPGWPVLRWCTLIAVVLALQFLFVAGLEDHSPGPRRQGRPAPVFQPGNFQAQEWFALEDPTLFALPHAEGFSGPGWINLPQVTFAREDWREPARWLPVDPREFGLVFVQSVRAQASVPAPHISLPPSDIATPGLSVPMPFPAQSSVHIEGALAARRLLSPIQVPPQHGTNLLMNTVVQVLVNRQGWTVSLTLLQSSTSHDADMRGLGLARSARFEPLPDRRGPRDQDAGLTLGTMTFEWQLLPGQTPDGS